MSRLTSIALVMSMSLSLIATACDPPPGERPAEDRFHTEEPTQEMVLPAPKTSARFFERTGYDVVEGIRLRSYVPEGVDYSQAIDTETTSLRATVVYEAVTIEGETTYTTPEGNVLILPSVQFEPEIADALASIRQSTETALAAEDYAAVEANAAAYDLALRAGQNATYSEYADVMEEDISDASGGDEKPERLVPGWLCGPAFMQAGTADVAALTAGGAYIIYTAGQMTAHCVAGTPANPACTHYTTQHSLAMVINGLIYAFAGLRFVTSAATNHAFEAYLATNIGGMIWPEVDTARYITYGALAASYVIMNIGQIFIFGLSAGIVDINGLATGTFRAAITNMSIKHLYWAGCTAGMLTMMFVPDAIRLAIGALRGPKPMSGEGVGREGRFYDHFETAVPPAAGVWPSIAEENKLVFDIDSGVKPISGEPFDYLYTSYDYNEHTQAWGLLVCQRPTTQDTGGNYPGGAYNAFSAMFEADEVVQGRLVPAKMPTIYPGDEPGTPQVCRNGTCTEMTWPEDHHGPEDFEDIQWGEETGHTAGVHNFQTHNTGYRECDGYTDLDLNGVADADQLNTVDPGGMTGCHVPDGDRIIFSYSDYVGDGTVCGGIFLDLTRIPQPNEMDGDAATLAAMTRGREVRIEKVFHVGRYGAVDAANQEHSEIRVVLKGRLRKPYDPDYADDCWQAVTLQDPWNPDDPGRNVWQNTCTCPGGCGGPMP